MKDSFTLPTTEKKHHIVKNCPQTKEMSPSKKTIEFLKLFARNCQVENSLPEGLQEMILG